MRIQKYLSEQGILSRREAEAHIRAGKILVNGKVAVIGAKIDPEKDKIKIVGEEISLKGSYFVSHKFRCFLGSAL